MQTKSRLSLILFLFVTICAIACGAALVPGIAHGATSDSYNLTVGSTLVGEDSSKWQGEGEARAYVYEDADFSYAYYPASGTLKLNGGTITGYYTYNNGSRDAEVGGVVSTNCVESSSMTLASIDNLSVEVAQDTKVLIPEHADTGDDPTARAFTDSSNPTATVTVSGPGTLTISTDGTINSCNVIGLYFHEVELSGSQPAHIVFDSIQCSSDDMVKNFDIDGIKGSDFVSIGQDCIVEFNSIEQAVAGSGDFNGISSDKNGVVVESGAQVTLHNLKYSCGKTITSDETIVALFHVIGDFTSSGDISIAPDVDDKVSISLANKLETGDEKIAVAGVTIDGQAANANMLVSGTFTMNNVTIVANAITKPINPGEVYLSGINNNSRGSVALNDLDFTFNKYGKTSITIGGESDVVLLTRVIDGYADIKAKNSTFNIALPKVDATYLRDGSNVAGLIARMGDMALSSCVVDICYSDITLGEESSFDGHAGLVAVNRVTLDETSRCTVKCTETGEMAGIEAAAVTLADDAMLTIQAPKGKSAIVNRQNSASYSSFGEDTAQQSPAEQDLSDTASAEIVSLAEGYNPIIAYGTDAKNAASATALEPEQYGENAYFAIANTEYDYKVSFDSLGGSAVKAQTAPATENSGSQAPATGDSTALGACLALALALSALVLISLMRFSSKETDY